MRRAFAAALLMLSAAAPARGQIPPQREDAAHTSGQYGLPVLVVRKDVLASLCDTDLDYCVLTVDSSGQLRVVAAQSGTWTVSQGGTWTVQPGNTANTTPWLAKIHDGTDAANVTAAGRVEVDGSGVTQPISGTVTANAGTGTLNTDQANAAEADYDSGAGTVNNVMFGLALPGAGGAVAGGTSSNPLRVDPTGSTTQPVSGTITANAGSGTFTVDSELPAVSALADNTANPTVPGVGTFLHAFDGTNWDRLQTGAAAGGALKIDGSAVTQPVSGTVTVGTFPDNEPFNLAQLGGTTTVTGGTAGTLAVGGIQAHDAAISGFNPLLVAGYASAAAPADVSLDGDLVRAWHLRNGAYVANLAAGGTLITATSSSLNVNCTGGCSGGTQYAEDTLHVSGDQVSMAGVVQQTADAALSGDGDRSVLQVDASGFLKVNIKAGAGSGGTAQADESAFTEGTTSMTPVGGVFNDTITSDPVEDQAAAVRITAKRGLHANLRNASGTEIGTAGAPVRTDPTGSTTQPVSGTVTANAGSGTFAVDSELPAAAALADNTANPTAPAVGTFLHAWDGTNWDRVQTGAATGGALKVDGSAVTQPVSGTVTANQGGAPWSVSGPAADGAAVSGNPVRVAGKDGSGNTQDVATDTAGELQVDILTLPSVTIGAFPDNEPFNVAQINGVAPLMGNGVTGTGSQRVTVANDTTGIATWGQGPTGSAVPSGAQYQGGRSGANMEGFERCDTSALLNMSTATTTEIVALTASQSIRVCSFRLMAGGTSNVKFVRGTGTNCATGQADVSANFPLVAQAGMAPSGGASPIYVVTSANALCVTSSAAVTVAVEVTYTKY